jgi:hypothetical protein
MSETLLDQIEMSLTGALAYNDNTEIAPIALLWPDCDCQFVDAADRLRSRQPLLTFGELNVDLAQGPAYWLRCAVAGTVALDLPEGIPIVYLPGVGRDDLRAIEECPRHLAPIAELQYRGQWFSHPNGKDWTVRAFLSNSDRGLGLDIAEDGETAGALLGAFDELLSRPVHQLASQYIDAAFLQHLLNPDPVARLLEWLDDPKGFRSRIEDARWEAFVGLCKQRFDFDPATEGELTGGRLLGERSGEWADVWDRFEYNPERYAGVEERLRKGKPQDLFAGGPPGSWPQDNEQEEHDLRANLTKLSDVTTEEARTAVKELWETHQERRNWVWARLDRTPLAFALEHLHRLAEFTAAGPSGAVDDLAASYADHGWKADDALVAALQAAPETDDRASVAGVATALYRPWLDAHARALQAAIGPLANAGTYAPEVEASTAKGTVTVFVDGLRLDCGHRVAERLGSLDVTVDAALSPLPTVTPTAKPVLTPVPQGSLAAGADLGVVKATSGAKASMNVLRSLMTERGVQVLQGAETGDPAGTAWTELGSIDERGHTFGLAFVDEIERELDDIAKRVKLLLDAGWQQVDVVTDHGWILLPGGLEKVELPAATVELKKGRCARLKDGADVSVPTIAWHWDQNVRIALAPGAACFTANQEYEHGGVSLQECVVPRISVRPGAVRIATGGAAITKVKWLGLMCRVRYENVAPGAKIDIRGRPKDASTSVVDAVKETTGGGKQALYVRDESLEGEEAYLVIEGGDGSILAQRTITIGTNR